MGVRVAAGTLVNSAQKEALIVRRIIHSTQKGKRMGNNQAALDF
jgi:hypothetical protein